MSTDTVDQHDHADSDDAHHGDGHAHGLDDKGYIRIFLFLVVVTGAEVALSYAVKPLGILFVPLLLTLMFIKFFTVASFFMHLRFDSKIFSFAFYAGLLLAFAVYIATLQAFQFIG